MPTTVSDDSNPTDGDGGGGSTVEKLDVVLGVRVALTTVPDDSRSTGGGGGGDGRIEATVIG